MPARCLLVWKGWSGMFIAGIQSFVISIDNSRSLYLKWLHSISHPKRPLATKYDNVLLLLYPSTLSTFQSTQVVEERRRRLQEYLRFVIKTCSSVSSSGNQSQPIINRSISKEVLVTIFPFFKWVGCECWDQKLQLICIVCLGRTSTRILAQLLPPTVVSSAIHFISLYNFDHD